MCSWAGLSESVCDATPSRAGEFLTGLAFPTFAHTDVEKEFVKCERVAVNL